MNWACKECAMELCDGAGSPAPSSPLGGNRTPRRTWTSRALGKCGAIDSARPGARPLGGVGETARF
eukprot:9813014-Alexandrium_andersonii.AAC.1